MHRCLSVNLNRHTQQDRRQNLPILSSNTSGKTGGQGGCSALDGVSGLMPGGVLVPARIRGSVGSMHYPPSTLVPTRLRPPTTTLLPTTPQACWDPNGQRCLFVPTCNCRSDPAHVVIQRTEPAHSAVDARRPRCRSYVRRYTHHHFTRICGARGCTCGLY